MNSLSRHASVARLSKEPTRLACLACLSALVSLGCNEGGERPEFVETSSGGSGGAEVGSGGSSTGGESLSLGGLGGETQEPLHLPFAVDDHYVPFGYMGAAQTGALESDPNQCTTRVEGGQGNCHVYQYAVPATGDAWAGIYWLTTYDNWGERPGRPIEGGASRVVFSASSFPAGAPVTFFVGGLGSPETHEDGFYVARESILEENLEQLELSLDGIDYEAGVLGGFGFSILAESGYRITIDDIRWE